jgi:type IV pilus assembly protein PilB
MDPDTADHAQSDVGAIVRLLEREGIVTGEQISFAIRIRSKLTESKPLLAVLKELEYVDDAAVKQALRKQRLDVRLGDLLVELGVLDPQDLRVALDLQQQDPARKAKLGEILVEHRFVDERQLTELLGSQLGFEIVQPRLADLDKNLLRMTNSRWMMQNEFIPIRTDGNSIVVAFADPLNTAQVDAARNAFGQDLQIAIAARSALTALLLKLDAKAQQPGLVSVDESAVVETVNEILNSAIAEAASDIHIEPMSDRLRIRFRQDGVMHLHREFPQEFLKPLSNRLKVMCEADLAERRRHQDARLFYTVGDHELDMRVSIYVTIHGEKIVMRLLNRSREISNLQSLDMAPHVLTRFLFDALERPSGVVLVTGPTGSGKTSTLYSCIHHIMSPDISILTAEDPVEYVIDGIGQCSVDPTIDRGFDSTLKQIVRQDPDVIVIGEIRDPFSADTAIQAALTGHKVLTTFHTEDSIGGLVRLLNMDIEAFLVSSTVVSVLAQRLLRRVCEDCAAPYTPTPNDLRRLGYVGNELAGHGMRIGRGCNSCRHTGYVGRLPVFELLIVDAQIRDAILNRRTAHEIRGLARDNGEMLSLLEDGIEKAARGLTTVHEIVRMLPRLDRPRDLAELRRLSGVES